MRAPIQSAQVDRFVHDRLPPREQWPTLRYELPELQLQDVARSSLQTGVDRRFHTLTRRAEQSISELRRQLRRGGMFNAVRQ